MDIDLQKMTHQAVRKRDSVDIFGSTCKQMKVAWSPGGEGGGDSNIKKVEVLVISLRGVNFKVCLA